MKHYAVDKAVLGADKSQEKPTDQLRRDQKRNQQDIVGVGIRMIVGDMEQAKTNDGSPNQHLRGAEIIKLIEQQHGQYKRKAKEVDGIVKEATPIKGHDKYQKQHDCRNGQGFGAVVQKIAEQIFFKKGGDNDPADKKEDRQFFEQLHIKSMVGAFVDAQQVEECGKEACEGQVQQQQVHKTAKGKFPLLPFDIRLIQKTLQL